MHERPSFDFFRCIPAPLAFCDFQPPAKRTMCLRFPRLFLSPLEVVMATNPRVDYALDLINRAQDAVLEAARELSGVPGFADQWKIVCDLHDQIKADWHRVEQARQTEQARKAEKGGSMVEP